MQELYTCVSNIYSVEQNHDFTAYTCFKQV
jgi:hypothetical protein